MRLRYDARQPPRMSMYSATIASSRYVFPDLKTLLAKASPARSGDQLAGIAAASGEERVAAQYALADVPLASVLEQPVIPYESDEVTRLIVDSHERAAFGEIAHLTWAGCATGSSPTPRRRKNSPRSREPSPRRWRRRSPRSAG
jgi:Ethanolamine ammonia lyase large subunit (EutB)